MKTQGAQRVSRVAMATVLAMFLATFWSTASAQTAGDNGIARESTEFLGRLSNALADVSKAAQPVVVNISTTSTTTMEGDQLGPMFDDPLFRHFFGDQFDRRGHGPNRQFKSSALGSGVIVTADGYILTNNHVVKDADKIKVLLFDKREFTGKVVGTDQRTDLAVVKIEATGLPTVTFGASGKLKTGDVVLAIGSPFGLNQTITMGIVSAVGRSDVGIADFEDFIQTDAAINPGNSGGALVNSSGELVGINTAIFSTNGGYMGIGFAIPSDMARSVMNSIIKTGKVTRGWMGVSIQNLTPELATSLGIKESKGALVSGVESGSPADKAGVKRGDLVIALDGEQVEDSTALRNRVAANAPQTKVELRVIRNGKELTLPMTLSERQERKIPRKTEYNNLLNGITVQELTPSLRQRMALPPEINGVVITDLSPDNPAHGLLLPHDVIEEVNRQPIKGAQDYEEVVSTIGEKDTILLLIYRNGGSVYMTINP